MMAKVQTLDTGALLELHIELKTIHPRIWRLVVVPDTITLTRLHDVIQIAMGWTDTHLHEFDIGGRRYGIPDPEWDFDDSVTSEKRVRLLRALEGRKSLDYHYDFGDGWEHRITVKRIQPRGKPQRYAICLVGENACPPEDVGGPYGYADYLEAINDKNHPDHHEMIEWRGEDFDPATFDLEETNEILKTIRL